MPSIQKQFRISETFDFNFGTQSGINLADQWDEKEFAYFNCGIGNYHCFAQGCYLPTKAMINHQA